jgi:predicted MFS family arabinose efflux permease
LNPEISWAIGANIETAKIKAQSTRMLVLFVMAHWGHHLLSSMIPLLLPFIRGTLEIDVAAAGGLVSAFTIAYGVSQLPSGWLADRLGRRLLILSGVSGVAFWGVMAGIAPTYGIMIVCMVFLGLLGGGYHPASSPAVSSLVEPRRRGLALGIHQIGGTLSNVSAPIVAAGLATSLSWRSAMVIPGLIVMALGIALFLLMGRTRTGTAVSGDATHSQTAVTHSRGRLILYITIGTAAQVVILSVSSFMALFLTDTIGVAAGMAAFIPIAMYLGGLPSGPIAGYLSDRLGASRVMFFASLIASPVIFLFSRADSLWFVIPLLVLMGVMMFTVMPVSEHYIISQTTEKNRSTVLGVYFAASRGGSGFLTLGLGYLIKATDYHPTFAIAGILLFAVVALCGLMAWLSGHKKAG